MNSSKYGMAKKITLTLLIILGLLQVLIVGRHLLGWSGYSPPSEYKLRKCSLYAIYSQLKSQEKPDLRNLPITILGKDFLLIPVRKNNKCIDIKNASDYYVILGDEGKWVLFEKDLPVTKNYRLSINFNGIITQYSNNGKILNREQSFAP